MTDVKQQSHNSFLAANDEVEKMNNLTVQGMLIFCLAFSFLLEVQAAPGPCQGPNKNDPGCVVEPPAAPDPPVIINSASVDWLNERILVNGDFTATGITFELSGGSVSLLNLTTTQVEIPFDLLIDGIPQGNHSLLATDVNTSSTISLYLKGQIVDQALTVCPCTTGWNDNMGTLWNPATKTTACLEITPGGAGNPEDIAGLIYTDSTDPAVYPQYAIGAAFTAEPNDSVCRLSKIENPGGPVIDLVNIRINRFQQGDCRSVLASNICATINGEVVP